MYRIGNAKINKRRALLGFFSAVLLAVLMLLSFYDYYLQNSILLRQSAYGALQESAMLQTDIIKSRLEERYRVLEAVNVFTGRGALKEKDELLSYLDEISHVGGFNYVGIVHAETGEAHSNTGKQFSALERGYFINALKGKRSIEYVEQNRIDEKAVLVLAIPMQYSGSVEAVLFGSFDMENFAPEMTMEGSEGYSYICDSKGRVIAKNDSPNALLVTDNILDTYKNSKMEDGITYEDVVQDLKNGKSSTVSYDLFGQKRYSSYSPMGIEDWYLFTMRTVSEIDSMQGEFTVNVFVLISKIIVALAVIFSFLIWREHREKEGIRMEQERYRLADEFIENVLFDGNYSRNTISFNHNFSRVFGWEPTNKSLSQMEGETERIHEKDRKKFIGFWQQVNSGFPRPEVDVRIQKGDQSYGWYRLEAKTIEDNNGKPQRVIGRISGIDAFKREVSELQGLSQQDPLTGLYNRGALKKRVEKCLKASSPASVHAMLLLDVDNFKAVNDNHGHIVGDTVLCDIAEKIKGTLRESDVISRLGGDEFMILVREINSTEMVETIACRLCSEIAGVGEGNLTAISCSIGIVLYPVHGGTFEELYEKADEALYRAKGKGKNQFCLYCSSNLDDSDLT